MSDSSPYLTCEQCKKRKVKCDKRRPCSACNVGKFNCQPVQRARLPRGRSGKAKQHSSLEDKVARLEQLLATVEEQVRDGHTFQESIFPCSIVKSHPQPKLNAHKVEDFVARDFWLALSNEVSGLRETLEASDYEDDSLQLPASTYRSEGSTLQSLPTSILFGGPPIASKEGPPYPLSSATRETLLHLYKTRVDVIFKILHWPTVLEQFAHLESSRTSAVQALENSVYFFALCTTSDEECSSLQIGERSHLLSLFRSRTEAALTAANLLTTTDSVILQAFVLYLACLRCCMEANSTWTLVALAIRIGNACGLNKAVPGETHSFDVQQRRRLWSGIGLLDSQSAFGRGSLPLMSHEDLAYPPLNINDCEMTPMGISTVHSSSFTDMTFTSLCHLATACQRKLCDPLIIAWQDRVNVVADFEAQVNQHFGQFEVFMEPIQRYTAIGARDMAVSMNLLLRRPPYPLTGIVPQSDNFDFVGTTCRLLQGGLLKQKHPDFKPYRWFAWPKWYALAILLTELLSMHKSPFYDRAYGIAQESFSHYAQSASEVSTGILWKPLAKLMRHVTTLKEILDNGNPMIALDTAMMSMGKICFNTTETAHDDPSTSLIANLSGYSDCNLDSDPGPFPAPLNVDPTTDASWLRWNSFVGQLGDDGI